MKLIRVTFMALLVLACADLFDPSGNGHYRATGTEYMEDAEEFRGVYDEVVACTEGARSPWSTPAFEAVVWILADTIMCLRPEHGPPHRLTGIFVPPNHIYISRFMYYRTEPTDGGQYVATHELIHYVTCQMHPEVDSVMAACGGF